MLRADVPTAIPFVCRTIVPTKLSFATGMMLFPRESVLAETSMPASMAALIQPALRIAIFLARSMRSAIIVSSTTVCITNALTFKAITLRTTSV